MEHHPFLTRPARPAEKLMPGASPLQGFASAYGGAVSKFNAGRSAVTAAPPPGVGATARSTRQAMNPGEALNRCLAEMARRVAGRSDRMPDTTVSRLAGADAQFPVTPGLTELRRQTANLPAVVSRAVSDANRRTGNAVAATHPTWHQVRNLAGYLSEPIRVMARDAFASFTNIPIEDIQVVAWLDPRMAGGTPNSKTETDALFGWISCNGTRDDTAAVEAGNYRAETQLWRTQHHDFLIVRDFIEGQLVGQYVYGWSGGRSVHLEAATGNQARLNREPVQNDDDHWRRYSSNLRAQIEDLRKEYAPPAPPAAPDVTQWGECPPEKLEEGENLEPPGPGYNFDL